MSFKDDVMFYLSKGRILNGVNIYENDDAEDQEDFDKEDETKEEDEEKDTKKKKCPDCGKEDCECDKDDDKEDDEAKAAVRDAKTDEAIKRVVKIKAQSRGKGPAPDLGATPEESAMYIGAMAASDKKKRDEAKKKKSVFTKTVADDDDDQYHPNSSISTKTAGADDDDDQYHSSVSTMREEILAYLK